MSVLDKVRKWIDGESAETVLEEAARDAQVKPRSQAEEFIVKIAREVEGVMQREIVPLPQGTMIIPSEYIIFLNDEDDKEWQGAKRRGLEQGLYHILAERAKEISGKRKLETKSFSVELRVDGTLEKGDVRVQHSWDDNSSNKTSILARPKIPSPNPVAEQSANPPAAVVPNPNLPPPNFTQNQPPEQLPATVMNYVPTPSVPAQNAEAEERTHVQKRGNPEIYRLEIWRGGVRQNVVPIYQMEVSIGRGSKSKPVDIPLVGDPEISRRHLTLVTDGTGNYWVVNEGRNPAMVNNYELPTGQKINVTLGVPIAICSYLLRIQPRT
ncbi:hypothetical protein BH10ACI1_BH10ACI1_07360 [soil metagenome]